MAPHSSSMIAFSRRVKPSVFFFITAHFIMRLKREKGRTDKSFLDFFWLSIIFFRWLYASSPISFAREQVLESTSPSTTSGWREAMTWATTPPRDWPTSQAFSLSRRSSSATVPANSPLSANWI